MQAEIFPFPPRRSSSVDGELPGDVVAMLRALAKRAAEHGADPSARVAADLELLLVCDTLIMRMRHVDESQCYDERRDKRRALRSLILRATKLKAETPTGLFAKAAAVRRVGYGGAMLAVSLADDLLASAALRAAIWPASGQE